MDEPTHHHHHSPPRSPRLLPPLPTTTSPSKKHRKRTTKHPRPTNNSDVPESSSNKRALGSYITPLSPPAPVLSFSPATSSPVHPPKLDEAKRLRDTDKFVEAASMGETRECAWRLLQGQGVNERHGYLEMTALMIASRQGHDEVVMLLLEEGASVDLAHRPTGDTALHYASGNGRAIVVKILLYGKSIVVRKEQSGRAINHVFVLFLCLFFFSSSRFRSAGANKSLRNKGVRLSGPSTPLQLAECCQKDEVRALLRDPPCQMATPLTTHFNKEEFSMMYAPPVSKGADLDGYRMVVKTHPGGT